MIYQLFTHTHIYLFQNEPHQWLKRHFWNPLYAIITLNLQSVRWGQSKGRVHSTGFWLATPWTNHPLLRSKAGYLSTWDLCYGGTVSSDPIRLIGCSSWLSRFTCASHIKMRMNAKQSATEHKSPFLPKPITNMSFFYCFSNHLKTDQDLLPSQNTHKNVLPNYYYYLLSSQHLLLYSILISQILVFDAKIWSFFSFVHKHHQFRNTLPKKTKPKCLTLFLKLG